MTDVKDRVLEAAKSLYTAGGYAGLSMRKVAKLAGVSTMASYRHFESKDHLVHALQVHAIRRYRDAYLAPLEGVVDAWLALRQSMDAYADFALNETEYFRIAFLSTERIAGLRELTSEGTALFDDAFRRSCAITARAIGDNDAVDETLRAWVVMHGLLTLYFAGRFEFLNVDFATHYAQEMDRYCEQLRNCYAEREN